MAVTFDAATTFDNATVNTFSHTVTASGGNRLLVVGFANAAGGAGVPTAVTYNGVAMTKFNQNTTNFTTQLWYLVNPATGANNVVKTGAAAAGKGMVALSFTNVDQTTPLIGGFTNNSLAAAGTWSNNITTVALTDMLVDIIVAGGPTTVSLTSTAPQTNRGTPFLAGSTGMIGMSTKGPAISGTQAMAWTWTNGTTAAGCGARIQNSDYVPPPASKGNLTLMGCG